MALLDGRAGPRPRAASRARSRAGSSPTSAPRSSWSSRPRGHAGCVPSATGSTPGARARGQVVVDRPRRSRARRAPRRRRRRARHARLPGCARRSTRRARPDAVWVSITPVRPDRSARGLARLRPRRDGGEREHVRHRRPRPRAGALHRAVGLRAHRAGGRVRRADRARGRACPHRVDVSMQEVVFVANMAHPRGLPDDRVPRPAARRAASAAPARSGRRRTATCRSGCAAARRACRASRPSRASSPRTASPVRRR